MLYGLTFEGQVIFDVVDREPTLDPPEEVDGVLDPVAYNFEPVLLYNQLKEKFSNCCMYDYKVIAICN